MAKIYSILNFKGGVGKTTTAINLAAGMNLLGKKVLLVDLDPQCNATSNLGFKRADGDTLYELLNGDTNEIPIYEFKVGYDFCPSSKLMKDINDVLVSKKNRERILGKILNKVADMYDYILIDCPPNGGLLNTNAMAASERLIVPLECEPYSMQGVANIIDELNDIIESEVNTELSIYGFLFTRYDSNLSIHKAVVNEIRDRFPNQIFNARIHKNTDLCKASAAKQTIFDYNSKAKGAEDYLQFAREITGSKKKIAL